MTDAAWRESGVENELRKALGNILKKKLPPSTSSINAICHIAVTQAKFYKFIAHRIVKFAHSCDSDYRLASLYIVDAVCKAAKAKKVGDIYAERFGKEAEGLITAIFGCPKKDWDHVIRVLRLWVDNQALPQDALEKIITVCRDITGTLIVPRTPLKPSPPAVTPAPTPIPTPIPDPRYANEKNNEHLYNNNNNNISNNNNNNNYNNTTDQSTSSIFNSQPITGDNLRQSLSLQSPVEKTQISYDYSDSDDDDNESRLDRLRRERDGEEQKRQIEQYTGGLHTQSGGGGVGATAGVDMLLPQPIPHAAALDNSQIMQNLMSSLFNPSMFLPPNLQAPSPAPNALDFAATMPFVPPLPNPELLAQFNPHLLANLQEMIQNNPLVHGFPGLLPPPGAPLTGEAFDYQNAQAAAALGLPQLQMMHAPHLLGGPFGGPPPPSAGFNQGPPNDQQGAPFDHHFENSRDRDPRDRGDPRDLRNSRDRDPRGDGRDHMMNSSGNNNNNSMRDRDLRDSRDNNNMRDNRDNRNNNNNNNNRGYDRDREPRSHNSTNPAIVVDPPFRDEDFDVPLRVLCTTLYVGGLSRKVTDEILRSKFSRYGHILSISPIKGATKAFVQFKLRKSAEDAKSNLDNEMIVDKPVQIGWALNPRMAKDTFDRERGEGNMPANVITEQLMSDLRARDLILTCPSVWAGSDHSHSNSWNNNNNNNDNRDHHHGGGGGGGGQVGGNDYNPLFNSDYSPPGQNTGMKRNRNSWSNNGPPNKRPFNKR